MARPVRCAEPTEQEQAVLRSRTSRSRSSRRSNSMMMRVGARIGEDEQQQVEDVAMVEEQQEPEIAADRSRTILTREEERRLKAPFGGWEDFCATCMGDGEAYQCRLLPCGHSEV